MIDGFLYFYKDFPVMRLKKVHWVREDPTEEDMLLSSTTGESAGCPDRTVNIP